MTKVPIDLEPASSEERVAFRRDAMWARVAGLAADKDHSQRDWRLAMRALKVYVRAMELQGKRGMTPDEARAFFSAWYTMLDLRRILAAADGAGLPEGDEP